MSSEQLTILRARSGLLAKRLEARGSSWHLQGYSAGRWFSVRSIPVHSLASLADALQALSYKPRCCVIRGEPLPGINHEWCRRLSSRAEHGDAVTFEPCPRSWLALDIDSAEEPPGLHFATEPEAGIEHVLGLLGPPFEDASCWWQAMSSAGIRSGIRCRLWFWCSRRVADEEAKGWLTRAPVDRALYTPVQPHYVAAPVLQPGVYDPVVRRCGLRMGASDILQVSDALPRVERLETTPVDVSLRELSEAERRRLCTALTCSPPASKIWRGERCYPDRSSRHFAFAVALARAGLRRCADYDLIAAALLELDRKLGVDGSKVNRQDYLARTIAAAMAATVA